MAAGVPGAVGAGAAGAGAAGFFGCASAGAAARPATEMIQSARAETAIEHRAGLHTVSMTVPAPDDATSRPHADGREFPVSQARVVDISV
ncbi:hypothetical protein [Methylobacterium oryzae]|uniref:hypothetical protein n=1 Tax=Methylobacterium oryzae TaxID=334852 RepID=UPI002F350D59